MKRKFRPWLHIALVLSLLASVLPMNTAFAAARITITSLYVTDEPSEITNGRPTNDGLVPRTTNGTHNLIATIEGITDSQISSLYLQIANVTNGTTVTERAITAQKTGAFEILFSNVPLTEGLNRIVVKLDGGSTVESAPAWIYYTATTSISDLKINGENFSENRFFPSNPNQSTVVNLSGRAPNASEVQAYLYGSSTPISGYLNQGEFFFIGDDINKTSSTASLKLRPGDNPLTLFARNNSKSFQLSRTLIYDNGGPFAFKSTIQDSTPTATKQLLVNNPVVQTPNVTVESLLKVDLNTSGLPEYRYVDVYAAGERFGPYDLSGALAAEQATDVFPKTVYEGHGAIDFVLVGSALDSTELWIQDKDGVPAASELPYLMGSLSADKTRKVFTLPAGTLTEDDSPYKITARKDNNGAALAEFTITVIDPGSVPAVTGVTFNGAPIREGNTAAPTHNITLNASPAIDSTKSFIVQITTLDGTAVGTGTGVTVTDGAVNIPFNLPSSLVKGQYKARLVYDGYTLSERYFVVEEALPPDPTISNVVAGSTAVAVAGEDPNPTHIFVHGLGFGTDMAQVTADLVGALPADQHALTLVYLENDLAVFRLADQEALTHGVSYGLQMYTPGVDPALVPNVLTAMTFAPADPNYDDKIVTSISRSQMLSSELGTPTGTVTLTGKQLNSVAGQLSVQVLNENGTSVATPAISNVTASSATVTMPILAPGSYIIRILNTRLNGAVTEQVTIGQFPFTVASPAPSSLTPNVRSVSATAASAVRALTVTGSNFGRSATAFKLRFTRGTTTMIMDAQALYDESRIIFDAPTGLAVGTYDAELLYNGVVMGLPMTYTVSSPPATLRENAQWSKTGEYRVYEFSANLALTSERVQTLEFRFYNVPTDVVPPTTYTFLYEDPTQPNITRVEMSSGGNTYQISDAATNDLNEQPVTFIVTTNALANGVNVYLGGYSSSADPTYTATLSENGGTYKKFSVTLNSLPSGINQIAFVPKTSDPAPISKVGENLAGRRTYSINVSSTPYVIVNNLHSGMVIRDIAELRCGTTTQCLTGRLINVADYRQLGIVVNGNAFGLDVGEFNDVTNVFNFRFGPGTTHLLTTDGGNLREGANTIEFIVYEDITRTRPLTKATYNLFKFSTSAPDFLSLVPVEDTDTVKYRPANVANSFVTNETTVVLAGQFANATEVKLTVKTVDPATGATQTIYDRRYGTGFNQFEPSTNNPNFFSRINQPSAGQFATRAITLASKGDTIFEFAITNATNIVVTRTITITREPLPYLVLNPKMTKNEQGVDQANINSNYVEFEIAAEGADAVLFDGQPAIQREVTDLNTGLLVKRFYYEARGLRNGRNNIEFTVVRGQEEIDADVVVNNVNTALEGAQFKTKISNRIRAFNGLVNLTFPRNTNLMRNDPTAINQFITADRQILFGIANKEDGRVDKYKHPAPYDGQIGNPNPLIPSNAKLILSEPTGRFRSISPLVWIDAGTIAATENDAREALSGSGRLPYDGTPYYNRSLKDLVVPSQVGELTLTYDPIVRNEGWKYVTVYHYDIYEDHRGVVGPRWRNIGGVVDPEKNTITVPFERFGFYQVMYMDQSYDDVISHPWARDQLDILYARGVMLNKNNTTFIPNDPISRGEFATLLVKIFDIPLQYTERPSFTDVLRVNPLANGLYDYKYIETAARAGIVRGAGGGRFQPDAAITRQDAAVMIARAANLRLESNETRILSQLQKAFTDANSIDIYARSAVLGVVDEEFILGKENVLLQGQSKPTFRFDPTATFTRAEAAEVAIRVMRANKKIPR
ncbi:S-layer homology domain-containing protein [Paenibacillus sp.]|uniref:S-layer homology domain-containing protein n=1 Tax=Paenibacillus sp. TaxID=58172 RepID=UPI002D5EC791|nr:S-layer homology domain-containing protein [Paenibacillus sp.]HZG57511.1 S-layer homology domain-containing protein [Paenibacillus sp.]